MISVCLATYNGERYIEKQLRSILSQLNECDEVIISDGGSSDNTLSILNSLNDSRIKTFYWNSSSNNNSTFGLMDKIRGNFENALIHAQGDIIFLSDQDDIWQNNKVVEICKLLKDKTCVLHNFSIIDNNEKIVRQSVLKEEKKDLKNIDLFIRPPFMGCCMAFTRPVLERALPFPNIHIEYDTWIGMCAHKIGKVIISNEIFLYYRRHGQNASSCTNKSQNPLWMKLMRRIYMLYAYIRF